MKRYIAYYLFPILLLVHISATLPPTNSSTYLTLTVSNIQNPKGRIRVAIYNSAGNFLDEKRYYATQNAAANTGESVTFNFLLPHGEYAVTTYHDINENRLLDRNTLGIPDEPYALSRSNVKWRKPHFGESKITFNQPNASLNLILKRWSER
jgi:uncharacterized protein (DUF2141 family)